MALASGTIAWTEASQEKEQTQRTKNFREGVCLLLRLRIGWNLVLIDWSLGIWWNLLH